MSPAPLARRLLGAALVLGLALSACGPEETEGPRDLGWIDDTLSPADRIHWPGTDRADGRVVPFLGGFGEGEPTGYWFLGFARPETIDSFWFCREGAADCPLDPSHRLNWDALVGHPLFSRVPGDPNYSHWWQMWTVVVPDDFEPDSITTVGTLFDEVGEGRVQVVRTLADFEEGPADAILHCALVLRGTELEDNGGPMPDGRGRRLALERHMGWRQGYRVEFIDFSPAEGVFPGREADGPRPRMPSANIYIYWRGCHDTPEPAICALPGLAAPDRRPVSERGLGQDITGDGDTGDTNNVVGALPCRHTDPEEKPYSPLWAVQAVDLPEGSPLRLMDDYGDGTLSDITSSAQMREAVAAGLLEAPRPQMGAFFDGASPAPDGQLFFNCPSPVAEDHVPFPCADSDG